MFNYLFRSLRPERFFFITCIIFSITFLIITPPFQSPDSFQHFYRIHQLSEGQFLGVKKDDQAGGFIPYGMVAEVEKLKHIPFYSLSKTSFSEVFQLLKDSKNLGYYENQTKTFTSFPNTILYPPPAHFPQLIAYKVSHLLDFTVYQSYYFICFVKFIFCFFLFYLSIFYAPHSLKWALTFFALLPMNIFLLPTLSPDSFIIALSFLIFTLALHTSRNKKKWFAPTYVVLSFLLSFSKIIYIFIPFIAYLRATVKKRSFQFRFFIVLCLIVFIPSILWSLKAKEVFVPLVRDDSLPKDPSLQLTHILSHSNYLSDVFINTFYKNGAVLFYSLIGNFGWMDTALPSLVSVLGLVLILLVSIFSMGSPHSLDFKWRDKFLAFIIVFGTFSLMFMSLLLTATVVGGGRGVWITRQVFLGLIPLLLILVPRFIFLNKTQFALPWMVRIGALFLLVFSIYTVIDRFYLT